MAGTVTIEEKYFAKKRAVICKCTSDASGDVSGTGFAVQGGDLFAIGYIPESGCSDNWDITVTAKYTKTDGSSITFADALGGEGANLSNSTNGAHHHLVEPFPVLPGMILTPVIANLGNAKTVTFIFYIWEEVRAV